MSRPLVIVLVLAAGASLAVQPTINAQLGRHVTSLGAALVSLTGSALVIGVILAASGGLPDLRGVAETPPGYLFGGVFGALNVTVALFAVSRLGAGRVAAVTVAAQLVVAGVLDWAGAFGLDRQTPSATRLLGFALLLGGVVLVTAR